MKKKIFNVLKYVFFLGLGVFMFWLTYRNEDLGEKIRAFKEVNYFWIVISLVFSMLSLVSRAFRWKLLINSIGYKPRTFNIFLSCNILYCVNLIVPRAGEIARCSVVSGTEKIPFTKLIGTMIVERLADMLALMLIAIVIFATNVEEFMRFFRVNPELLDKVHRFASPLNISLAVFAGLSGLALIVFLWKRAHKNKDSKESIITKIIEGVKSISKLEKKWLFFAHTGFIFLMWLGMLYVVFLAYEPTKQLSVGAGAVTFLMGGLAMLAPIQGGIGAWHWMVATTLTVIYFIPDSEATTFAFIAHTATNLVYLVFGLFAYIALFIYNSGNVHLKRKQAEE